MLNLNHLRYFHLTAQFKSVTRAAEYLSISQPSLSQQLTVFEDKLGFSLFYRSGRNFELTPEGKSLYSKTIGLFASVDEITDFIEKKQPDIQQSYSIAVCDEIERPFISDVVGQLMSLKSSEKIKFDIISKAQFDIVEEFYSSKHEILITNRALKRYEPAYVFDFPVKLITSQKNETTHKINENNLKSLFSGLGESLAVVSQGSFLREEMDDFLFQEKVDAKIIFESNILSCVSRAVRQGVGCGFLPVVYVNSEIKAGKMNALGPKKGFWTHKIYLYSKKANVAGSDPVLARIIKIIQDYLL